MSTNKVETQNLYDVHLPLVDGTSKAEPETYHFNKSSQICLDKGFERRDDDLFYSFLCVNLTILFLL